MGHNTNDAINTAALEYAYDLLTGFDIQDDESRDFLGSLVVDGQVPKPELKQVFELALLRGKEEWDMIFACAGAIRSRTLGDARPDPGLAPYLAYVLAGRTTGDGPASAGGKKDKTKGQRKRSEPRGRTSQFWHYEKAVARKPDGVLRGTRPTNGEPSPSTGLPAERSDSAGTGPPVSPAEPQPDNDPSSLLETAPEEATLAWIQDSTTSPGSVPSPLLAHYHSPVLKRTRSFRSPFFAPSPAEKKARPPRGTISSLPFPPLSAPRFGLIQESLSRDPFRLLVAVTFLIRTTGKAAIPVYHKVMDRFPTPEAFLAADLEADLIPMIAHLGLPAVRCAAIGKYARIWTERPPLPGARFVVRGYPRLRTCQLEDVGGRDEEEGDEGDDGGGRESDALRRDDQSGVGTGSATSETPTQRKRRKSKLNSSESEIGHLTQGRYAIDSWRIFCRDIFLGKSDDWMGLSGHDREPEESHSVFEPEWMRVLPEDKELRACLRWMWMRQGFEWDPVTGSKIPLGVDMRVAVEEGRVKYDNKGQLVILEELLDLDEVP
jgi:hypothetical protein